ncbi:hypothetical protein B7R21_06250 [Subtercola boreus]|uniref:Uncharacterized protein n=2 Tax=Subtercola boreus TaxID=120213 RepID=A0A3E0VZ24_9MICO|nr:hypothetical protein B7R21_06250 [Subtercola boreus]
MDEVIRRVRDAHNLGASQLDADEPLPVFEDWGHRSGPVVDHITLREVFVSLNEVLATRDR